MSRNLKIFFIGDVAIDEYYRAPYFPALKEKIIVQNLPHQMGGMIANAACVFASYGTKPSFMTALNSGEISQKLCKSLNNAGIDTSFMVWDDTLPDSKTIIILAENEHTVFIPTMNLQKIELSKSALAALCQADYIYSTFCELRPLSSDKMDCEKIISKITSSGCKLWCDLDVGDIQNDDEKLLKYIDTIFINELGYHNLTERAGGELSPWLFSKGVKRYIVTKAENGCMVYSENGDIVSIPGIKVKVEDVTGAGDTFCSSFLYAYTKTPNVKMCAEFANHAAALSVTKLGPRAGAAGVEEVVKFAESVGTNTSQFEALLK